MMTHSLAGECEGIQISSTTKEKATRAKVNVIVIIIKFIIISILILLKSSLVRIPYSSHPNQHHLKVF